MQQQPCLSVWRWFLATVRRYWLWLAAIMVIAAIQSWLAVALPLLWQRVLDAAVNGTFDYEATYMLVGVMVLEVLPVMYVLRSRFHARYNYTER